MNDRTRLSALVIHSSISVMLVLSSIYAAHANQPPDAHWYSSELEAVVAAAGLYSAVSIREDREFMGAVLRDGDRYAFTVGAGAPGRDKITVKIRIPHGVDVVAFWHTHGARTRSNQYFSEVDTQLVKQWQKPFYLADYTGILKVMVPGGRTLSALRARRLGLPARAGFAAGQVVNDSNGDPIRIVTR